MLRPWIFCAHRQAIDWKRYMQAVKANTASASMTNGVCVLSGLRTGLTALKLLIAIEGLTHDPPSR